jgi:LemA protein
MVGLLVTLGVIAVIAFMVIGIYNSLVRAKNRTEEAWSDIDVQLKRRYDLIPNLVETVKGYAKHEKEVLENVTKARNMAVQAGNVQEQAEAENMLTGALKSLFAVSESYPDLKANQNFLELQRELRDTEDKIMASRRFYNSMAQTFNTKIEVFPNNVVIGLFGAKFTKFDYFEIEDPIERENVKVDF